LTLHCVFLAEVGAIVEVVIDGAEMVVCAPPPGEEVVAVGILVVVACCIERALDTRLNSVLIQAISVDKIVGFKASQVIGLLWRNRKYQHQLWP
jgi:hypothetical protein